MGVEVVARQPLHQRRRRRVLHKILRQFVADMVRGRRVHGQDVERHLAFAHAELCHFVAEPGLVALIVAPFVKREGLIAAHQGALLIGPAGEHARQFRHVFLAVAAVHAQRVQFHQLARVVFIQPARLGLGRIRRHHRNQRAAPLAGGVAVGIGDPGGEVIIEVVQHGRMLRRRPQQVAEPAHRMRPDGVPFVAGHQRSIEPLAGKHIEMVVPEIDHCFFELARTVDGAQHARFGRLQRDGGNRGAAALFGAVIVVAHLLLQLGVTAHDLAGGAIRAVKRGQARAQRGGVRNCLGMQLAVDVALHPHLRDALDVARLRAVTKAVEHMHRLLFKRHARGARGQCGQQQRADQDTGNLWFFHCQPSFAKRRSCRSVHVYLNRHHVKRLAMFYV